VGYCYEKHFQIIHHDVECVNIYFASSNTDQESNLLNHKIIEKIDFQQKPQYNSLYKFLILHSQWSVYAL